MKTLIVYYSMNGHTKAVAEKLAKALGGEALRIAPVKKYPDKGARKFIWGGKSAVMGEKPKLEPYIFNAEKYDAIVLGTPVWASNISPPMRTFIDENKDALNAKKTAAFVCSMGGGWDKALVKLKKCLGTDSLASELSIIEGADGTDGAIKRFCAEIGE